MKRFFLLLAIIAPLAVCAETVTVTTKDGAVTNGNFVDGTNSTYTISCKGDTITFRMQDIYEVCMYDKIFVPVDGELVALKSAKKTDTQPTATNTYIARPANPNLVIGKAMKSIGGVSMGVGVPCMVAGAVMWAVGLNGTYSSMGDYTNLITNAGDYSMKEIVEMGNQSMEKNKKNTTLMTAGICLTSVGGALTIVGIPLYVHGNKIMTMNLNYTGNGVGLAMQF